MITNAASWKAQLKTQSSLLAQSLIKTIDEANFDFVEIERPILYCAIIIRRMSECTLVTTNLYESNLKVKFFKPLPSADQSLFFHAGSGDIAEFFDFEGFNSATKPTNEIPVSRLLNDIIHARRLVWGKDDDGKLGGMFVASDHNQKKRLVHIDFKTWQRLIDRVVEDKVVARGTAFKDENEPAKGISFTME